MAFGSTWASKPNIETLTTLLVVHGKLLSASSNKRAISAQGSEK